jgi:hypothetical protein
MSDLSSIFGSGFDSKQELPPSEFDLVPPGLYPAIIEKSEVKATKKGDGHYINEQFGILDGPAKGRKVFKNFNIQNPSEKAVNIGLRELQDLNKALGIDIFKDTNQHLNQMCLIKVVVKEDQNDIRGFKAIAALNSQPQALSPTAWPLLPLPNYETKTNAPVLIPPVNTGQPPWMRK